MTKNKNYKNIAFWIFGIMSITLTFIACRKNFTESAIDIFSQSEAKEWYYGTFKKSPEWQQSNEKGEKLPDWKNGTYRRVGNMEIVEFPLMKERKSYSIPSASKLSSSEIRKIADGSLSRIAFIRASNSEIVVRELDYIPNIDFLKVKGYDISDIRLGSKENNFSGRVITKKWDGTILSTRKFENGKITKSGKRINNANFNIESLSSATKNNSSGCAMVEIMEYERTCTEVHRGDVWIPTGECTPWEPTGNSWVEEQCSPSECDYGSSEECECQLFGMGCDDGGGGDEVGEEPPPPPNPCKTAKKLANNTEFKEAFDALKSIVDAKAEVGFTFKVNGETGIDETLMKGIEGEGLIDFKVPEKIDGFIHTHYEGLLSVFSPADIFAMSQLYLNDKMVNPGTFTMGVVTASGTQYLLMIDNLNEFSKYANMLVGTSSLDEYSYSYETIFKIKPTNSPEDNEKAFIQFLDAAHTGLKLLKGDATFSNWSRRSVDENHVVVDNPCK
jgi:hypothetical protein